MSGPIQPVELEHSSWERLGDQAAQARASYEGGWPGVLDAFAGAAVQVHHRAFARSLNGLVWRLLARADRTAEDDARMVDAAHASQLHWREAGGPPATRGEWLVSHVYAVLGRPEPALLHARRCLDLAAGWRSRATAAGAAVADDEDRKIFAEELATGPWFGLNARQGPGSPARPPPRSRPGRRPAG